MMILLCFMVILFFIKDFLFINSFFHLDGFFFFLVTVSLFILFLLLNNNFNYSSLLMDTYGNYLYSTLVILFIMNFYSSNLIFFLITFEIVIFPMGYMILKTSYGEDKIDSLFMMVLMNFISSIPFMLGCSMFYSSQGSINLGFFQELSNNAMNDFIFIFMSLILLFKLPLFLLHYWLPKAHVSSSGSCSILLAGVMIKMSSVALFKFSFMMGFNFFFLSLSGFFLFSGFMVLSLSLFRFMFDMKIFVAYSSILHMCPLLFCFNEGFFMSINSGSMISIIHGLISPMMFYFVTIIYEINFSRSFFFTKGLAVKMNFMFFIILFVTLLNFGFPPFMSFFSEILLGLILFKSFTLNTMSFIFSFFYNFITMFFIFTHLSFSKFNNFNSFMENVYLTFSLYFGVIIILVMTIFYQI